MLNESPDLLVVDDLYYLQQVAARNAFDSREPERLAPAVDWLISRVRGRSTDRAPENLSRSLPRDGDALDRIEAHGRSLHAGRAGWSEILGGVLALAARLAGKSVWGYKTPQDFMHIGRLRRAFPGVRFVYVLREPYSILRSYKNANRLRENLNPARYHPMVQSLYWRACSRHYLKEKASGAEDVTAVRYEGLVGDPDATVRQLSGFLGVRPGFVDLASLGTNTSGARQELTATEQWLCNLVAGRTMTEIGYAPVHARPRVADTSQLLGTTFRAARFHATNAIRSTDSRDRVRRFVRQCLRQA